MTQRETGGEKRRILKGSQRKEEPGNFTRLLEPNVSANISCTEDGCFKAETHTWRDKMSEIKIDHRTENERNRDEIQNIVDVHFGKKNVVEVMMRESWNYSATYQINGGSWNSYDYYMQEFKKLN